MSNQGRRSIVMENLRIALDVVQTHKLRSGLIILGVAIGVDEQWLGGVGLNVEKHGRFVRHRVIAVGWVADDVGSLPDQGTVDPRRGVDQ